MPTWMKVLLIIGVLLVVLLVVTAVAGYFVVRTYGPGLVEAGKQTYTEGVEYGKRTDNQGCLDEAAARHARAEGFAAQIKNTVFMRACFEASRPTPGFCDAVPRPTEFGKTIGWQAQQCQHYGLTPQQQCSQLFSQVQQFCEVHRQYGRNSNEDDADKDTPPPPPPAPRQPPPPPTRTR